MERLATSTRSNDTNPSESLHAVYSGHALAPGAKGTGAEWVRGRLGLPAGKTFDAATEKAVKAWQREHGLPATGVVDKFTAVRIEQAFVDQLGAFELAGDGVDRYARGELIIRQGGYNPSSYRLDAQGTPVGKTFGALEGTFVR